MTKQTKTKKPPRNETETETAGELERKPRKKEKQKFEGRCQEKSEEPPRPRTRTKVHTQKILFFCFHFFSPRIFLGVRLRGPGSVIYKRAPVQFVLVHKRVQRITPVSCKPLYTRIPAALKAAVG